MKNSDSNQRSLATIPIEELTAKTNNIPLQIVVGIIKHPITHKILIAKRTEGQHLSGLWEFPGGKIECEEDQFHALQRELFEEVGVKMQAAHPYKQITYQYPEKSVCLNFWKITHFIGNIESKEQQQIQWVNLDELESYQFPEANQSIVESLSLPKFWMITPDCEIAHINKFIAAVEHSLIKHDLKQLLFRSKNLNNSDYEHVSQQLNKLCGRYKCQLILHRDKIDVVCSKHWHLTSSQLHSHNARPYDGGMLSASCHTLGDIKQAEKIGVNFIVLSAVKHTKTHPSSSRLGWVSFKAMANQTYLPVYALGGVNKDDLTLARYHGAIGVAGITTFK